MNEIVTRYQYLHSELEQQRTLIGSLDTLIATQALSLQVTLITNNLKEFNRIPNLKLVNWVGR